MRFSLIYLGLNKINVLVYIVLLLFFSFPLFCRSSANAATNGKYITIVNPVRDRSFWQNTNSVLNQINFLRDLNLPSTWLLQYSAFSDQVVIDIFNKLPADHELGIFLEVDEKLATDALVPYLIGQGDWARADKVFLSGYSPSERKRMIDLFFNNFKSNFGFYPTAVGAWYIDTISLNYMVDKYNIAAILDVSDQYQTDTYGVWGKPWGTPYYPSKWNSLIPAGSSGNKLPVVKIQWAQRDAVRGYGLTVFDSTYSLQANDYIGHQLKTDYFVKLSHDYLQTANPISQLTVGLEAGQEGASFFEEFKRQIISLTDLKHEINLHFATMTDFATKFKTVYPKFSPSYFIEGTDYENPNIAALWYTSPFYRVGLLKDQNRLQIRDFRLYDKNFLFTDIFERDNNRQLKRIITPLIDDLNIKNGINLISDIKDLKINYKAQDYLEITALDNFDKIHVIVLEPKTIFINKKPIIEIEDKNKLLERVNKNIVRLIVDYQVRDDYNWTPSIRFSLIENVWYFGLWTGKTKLIGFRTTRPFIGVFDFPFQVLARFKTIPALDGMSIVSEYFINNYKPSTINIKI